MLACFDIDGTIDAFPDELGALMRALRATGSTVQVLSGIDADELTPDDLVEKSQYLTGLGLGESYDRLVLVPRPHAENKASYMREAGVDLLVDNDKGNAAAAADICPVLVPWQSRVKGS